MSNDALRSDLRCPGVGRDAENDRSLALYFNRPVTDDEMRSIHDAVRAALAREAQGETITTAAIKFESGVIATVPRPGRHHTILHGLDGAEKHQAEQGFLTSSGRFVGRVQGAEIAWAAGQLRTPLRSNKLFSEDLWTNNDQGSTGPGLEGGGGEGDVGTGRRSGIDQRDALAEADRMPEEQSGSDTTDGQKPTPSDLRRPTPTADERCPNPGCENGRSHYVSSDGGVYEDECLTCNGTGKKAPDPDGAAPAYAGDSSAVSGAAPDGVEEAWQRYSLGKGYGDGDHYRIVRAAFTAGWQAQQEWRPIETCPDGALNPNLYVWVYFGRSVNRSPDSRVERRLTDGDFWRTMKARGDNAYPTHWMPEIVPSPPLEGEGR